MRTKPPTVPGIERRNSSPAIPASRAVEDTRMPDAPPPQRSVVASMVSTFAKGLPRRTTTPGKPPSRTMRLDPRPSAITEPNSDQEEKSVYVRVELDGGRSE